MENQTTGQPQKASMFATAKVVEKKTTAKDDKVIVQLLETEFPGISAQIDRVNEIRKISADLEAEGKMLEGQIKEIGKSKFLELYAQKKVNPGSFVLKGEKGGAMMCIVMDKYLSIDSARAEELKSNFGEDTVSTSVEYSFNAELLKKYEYVLSDLIFECDKIAEADKPLLIEQKPKHTVAKGMIERIGAIAGNAKDRMEAVLNAIQPVIQLKNYKLIALLLIAFTLSAQAQTSTVKLPNGNYRSAIDSTGIGKAKLIGSNFIAADNQSYPIYKSEKGKYFIVRRSKKTDNPYHQYLNIQE